MQTHVELARSRRRGVAGRVGLVVAEIRGRQPSALLVTASVDGSKDGPDVAAALGPAVLLELARVLRAGERPSHTVLLVATESAGESLGVRGLDRSLPVGRTVALEVALEPRGLEGEAALLWASPRAGFGVDAWAAAVDSPGGGAHLSRLLPARPAWRRWPALAIGTRRGVVAPGSPDDRPARVALGTLRSFGQSALQLVRAADAQAGRQVPAVRPPAFVELPLHVVLPLQTTTAVGLGWIALAVALWGLVRLRRHLQALVVSLPWGATGVALAITAMAALSEAIARHRGTVAPLQASAAAHVAGVVLAGAWVLLAWQRLGALGPLRRVAMGLSQPAVLALLSVITLGGATLAALVFDTPLTPLAAVPLLVAVPSALAVSRAADRRGRFVGSLPMSLALVLVAGPAFADAVVFLGARQPGHVELALGIAALVAPLLPVLATVATASVLRPGAGQLALVGVVTAALAVWSGTAPLATVRRPRRVVLTAVSDARPGRSVFLVASAGSVRVGARRVARPWFAAAVDEGRDAVAFAAPDGLVAPPEVYARLVPGPAGTSLLEARVRALRRAESIAIVLPPATRLARSSLPVIRTRKSEPWIARFFAPPSSGLDLRMELVLPRGKTLGDVVAVDGGTAELGPFVPRIDRAWPTRTVVRAAGVTPFDVTYATPPPPPVLPPDDPAPPPAGPEPWWSIMARERFRRGGVQPPR